MVAQASAERAPELIDRLILAGSGPVGGPGLTEMTRITISISLRAVLTFKDPKVLLFFTRTSTGKKAAREYLARLKERTTARDKAVTPPGVYRAQLAAVHRWGGMRQPAALSQFTGRCSSFTETATAWCRLQTRMHSPGSYGPPRSQCSRIPGMASPSKTTARSSTRPGISSAASRTQTNFTTA